jgi:hypothetical protein
LFEVQGKTPKRLPRATQVCYAGYAMVKRERLGHLAIALADENVFPVRTASFLTTVAS